MKNIKSFIPEDKYAAPEYEEIAEGIYRYKDKYVTALSFQQEPELDEGESAADISQYPLEDILDKFCVYISDFFEPLNDISSQTCYLEFTGFTKNSIDDLRTIIGKHVYCREIRENNDLYAELIIE